MIKISKSTLKNILNNIDILEININNSKQQLTELKLALQNLSKQNKPIKISFPKLKKTKDTICKSNRNNDDKEKYSILIANNIKTFFGINSDMLDKDGKIQQSYFNSIINTYLVENDLIVDNYVKLNTSLKKLLNIKKQKVKLDSIFNLFC